MTLTQGAVPQWRDISTAPKDGTFVRLKFGDGPDSEADEEGPYVAAWFDDCWLDRNGCDFGYGAAEPTEWAPEQP